MFSAGSQHNKTYDDQREYAVDQTNQHYVRTAAAVCLQGDITGRNSYV